MKRIKASFQSQGFLFPTGYISDRLVNPNDIFSLDGTKFASNAIGESYGWWPNQCVNIMNTLTSVPGALNGNRSVDRLYQK